MADSADTGHEDHADRPEVGDLLRIVSRAAGHRKSGEAQRARGICDYVFAARVCQGGMVDHRLAEMEARAVQFADSIRLALDLVKQTDKLLLIEVADFDAQSDLSRHHVVCARLGFDPAHCANLCAGHTGPDLVHLFNESRGRKQGILAMVHRRSARVVGEAFDSDFGLQNAHDAFHQAYVDFRLFQPAALFDVQLEIAGDAAGLALCRGEAIGFASQQTDTIADGFAAVRYAVQLNAAETPT